MSGDSFGRPDCQEVGGGGRMGAVAIYRVEVRVDDKLLF